MMWLEAKNSGNEAIVNRLQNFVDANELDDSDFDEVQDVINDNISFDDEEIYFSPGIVFPMPSSSKIDPATMEN